jgi:hypothetical protein
MSSWTGICWHRSPLPVPAKPNSGYLLGLICGARHSQVSRVRYSWIGFTRHRPVTMRHRSVTLSSIPSLIILIYLRIHWSIRAHLRDPDDIEGQESVYLLVWTEKGLTRFSSVGSVQRTYRDDAQLHLNRSSFRRRLLQGCGDQPQNELFLFCW